MFCVSRGDWMSKSIRAHRASTSVFGFLYEALHVSILSLKLWHALAIAAIAILSLYNIVGLDLLYTEISEKARPIIPIINIILQVIPFVAVALIWTLRKLLDDQIEVLGNRIEDVQASTSSLTTAATNSAVSIQTSSATMVSNTQTAANGLSTSASIAASDVAVAADSMARAASEGARVANSAADRVRDEAELAHAKLSQQAERLRNEIERLSDELEAKSDQILRRLLPSTTSANGSAQSTSAAEAAIAADTAALDRWEAIRSAWRDTRDDMAIVIAHIFDHEDGRRTKHMKFDFRNYGGVARKLEGSGFLSAAAREAIEHMDSIFNRLKRRSSKTTDSDVAEFGTWRERFRLETKDRREDYIANGK